MEWIVDSVVERKRGRAQWNGIPTVEVSPAGTILVGFYSGGPKEPHPDNFVLYSRSFDRGLTWTEPEAFVNPPGKTRAWDPLLWYGPDGKLRFFYQISEEPDRCEIWYQVAEDPDAAEVAWSEPVQIKFDYLYAIKLNKPLVLSSGTWLLPVVFPHRWGGGEIAGHGVADTWLVGVARSEDKGRTWKRHGELVPPDNWGCENMMVERMDGSVWMLLRTGTGYLWESTSYDGGLTWSPLSRTDIENPNTRFYIGRLSSGRLLLINTPNKETRSPLVMFLSEDDGRSWLPGVTLDSRPSVSYPDARQTEDGTIHIVYDHDRKGSGEIRYRAISEEAILEKSVGK